MRWHGLRAHFQRLPLFPYESPGCGLRFCLTSPHPSWGLRSYFIMFTQKKLIIKDRQRMRMDRGGEVQRVRLWDRHGLPGPPWVRHPLEPLCVWLPRSSSNPVLLGSWEASTHGHGWHPTTGDRLDLQPLGPPRRLVRLQCIWGDQSHRETIQGHPAVSHLLSSQKILCCSGDLGDCTKKLG